MQQYLGILNAHEHSIMAINEQFNFNSYASATPFQRYKHCLRIRVSWHNLYVWNKFQNITKNIILKRQIILKSPQTNVTLSINQHQSSAEWHLETHTNLHPRHFDNWHLRHDRGMVNTD